MWKRLGKLTWRLLHLSAWLLVLLGATLLFLEESGLLTRLVRDRLAREMGELGDVLSIEDVELRWFEPGVLLHDVRIAAPTPLAASEASVEDAAPDTTEATAEDVLHLRRIHLSFEPALDLTRPLRRVVVRGGRVRLSDDLSRALERLGSGREDEGEDAGPLVPWDELLRPPPLVFHDLAIELQLPSEGDFDLGRASLAADPLQGGGYQLDGRLEPSLGGAIGSTDSAILIDGRLQPSGAYVRAMADRLRFASEELQSDRTSASLPFEHCAGQLSVAVTLELNGWGEPAPELSGSLRASLRECGLTLAESVPAVQELEADVDARFALNAGERVWRREAWSARATASADWNASPLEVWAAFGRDVPGDDWAHAWGRIQALDLSASTLDALNAPEVARSLHVALEPTGTADVALDVRVAEPPAILGGATLEPRLALHASIDGTAGATYRGVYDVRTERRYGFPLPVEEIEGHVVFGHDPTSTRPDQVWFDVSGDPGSGSVRVDGELVSPLTSTPDFLGPELDLRIDVRVLPLDEGARLALSDHPGTLNLWPTWSPSGGTVDSFWRLYASPVVRGMGASGEVVLKDASLRWSNLPVPLTGVDGSLRFAWARHPVLRSDDPRGRRKHRPMGVAYSFTNLGATERTGIRASARGVARQLSVDGPTIGPEVETRPWVQAIEVQLPELFLRGSDWEVLAERTPELSEVMRSLGAKGSARATYRGLAHAHATDFVSDVEAAPLQVEVTPEFFQRRTRDLAGRVLVRTARPQTTADEEPAPTRSDARFHLSGRWSQGVELAASGLVPSEGNARIELTGAGIDPANNAFRGAFLRSLAEGSESGLDDVDLSTRTLSGLLDLGVEVDFEKGGVEPPKNAYRVFLRGNVLETETLRLGGLRGMLEQRERVLRSDRLLAELAGHPLELRDVLVFRLGDANAHPDRDPLFDEPGMWSDPEGLAIQARLSTTDLPLDVEHLSALLPAEALAPLEESGTWSGELDVPDARILLTTEDSGRGIVAIQGLFRPHDLTTRLGVPIRVRSAELNLGEFILEGERVRGWGEIKNLDADLAGRRLEDARMVVGYVDGRLTIDNLAGAFEGGELVALGAGVSGSRKALGIDLSPPYRFDLAMSLEDVELDRILRGVFPSSIADQGRIDLQLSLSGTPGDVRGMTGGGWVRLDEGRLWSIPVARALFYQLGIPDTALFDRMRARFQLRDGRLEGSYLEMKSSLLNLIGSGWLDLDGRLAMDLEVRYSILDKLGSLSRILYWLNDNLWRVAVRGDLVRPKVSIRNVFLELFGGFEDAPRRELPLPGVSDLGPRF